MKPVSDSKRILQALDEQDRAFQKLAPSPATTVLTGVGREISAEASSAIRKFADQLSSPEYQRAVDAVRQLSMGIATSTRGIPLIEAPRATAPTGSVRAVADLGALIRRARKAMKMNQSEFAAHAGVGRRFVSELESGKPSLEFDRVMACVQAAGIDLTARLRSR